MDLLFRLKQNGSLPAISDQLGNRVRTNAESLIGVRVPRSREDLSKGIAIGSGSLHRRPHAHRGHALSGGLGRHGPARHAADRRPAGADAHSAPGSARSRRSLLRHPLHTIRCLHPFGWARESLILLCMQTLDGHIDMRLGRPWFWPFQKMLMSHGRRIPTFIPQANEFAREGGAD